MAGRATPRVHPSTSMQVPNVDDMPTQRALDVLADSAREQQARPKRDRVTFDLVVGTNHVQHSLGHACIGYTLTPTTADATFAHAIDSTNPHPEREVWIVVVGVDQPKATLEVF